MKIKDLLETKQTSEALEYRIQNHIPLSESVFRVGSNGYFELFNEARRLYRAGLLEALSVDDCEMLESDIGKFGIFEGKQVPLDCPLMEEKTPPLNKPKRGGPKKYYVYVRDPKTKRVKRINFGDSTGLSAKINDPKARKSFVARHQCDKKKDKTKAGYWACRLPRYSKSLGLSGGGSYLW
jgi:hypothetical protein